MAYLIAWLRAMKSQFSHYSLIIRFSQGAYYFLLAMKPIRNHSKAKPKQLESRPNIEFSAFLISCYIAKYYRIWN